MVLALNDNFKRAFTHGNAEARFHVTIDTGVDLITATDGLVDDPSSFSVGGVDTGGIVLVTPLAQEISPLSRRIQTNAVFVTCQDKWIRPYLVNNRVKGQKVTIKLGAKSIAFADYVNYFVGIIDNVKPTGDGQTVVVTCLDLTSSIKSRDVVGYWNQIHPLDVIVELLGKGGIPSSQIDLVSFDPATAANAPVGHFVVGRSEVVGWGQDGTIRDPSNPIDLINELLVMMNGSLVIQEDGQIAFKIFDAAAATVADWTDQHIDDFEQEDLDSNVINRVLVSFLGFPKEYSTTVISTSDSGAVTHQPVTKTAQGFQLDETASQTAFEHPDASDGGVYEARIPMPWVNGMFYFDEDNPFQPADGVIRMNLAGQSICGFREFDAGPQPTEAVIGGARPAHFYIQGEILEVTSIANLAFQDSDYNQRDPALDFGSQFVQVTNLGGLYDLTVTRAAFGSVAAALDIIGAFSDYAIDITIPLYAAQRILERFAFGAFTVNLSTSLAEFDKQLLDLVTLDNRNFVGFGFDGIVAASGKWEIVSKVVEKDANPPRIAWRVMFVPTQVLTVAARSWLATHRGDFADLSVGEQSLSAVSQAFISDGLDINASGGLNATIDRGTVKDATKVSRNEDTLTKALAANSDTYFWMDTTTGQIETKTVANAAPAPVRTKNQAFIGKVITDGASVTSVVQNKDPITGNVVVSPMHPGTAQFNSIGANAIDTRSRKTESNNQISNFDFGSFTREPLDFKGT